MGGYKLLILLFTSQHLIKGFVSAMTGPAMQYLFASYKVAGPRMQVFSSVAALPWAMKPVIGLVSDAFPIMGYHKGPYVILFSVCGISACAVIGGVPQSFLTVETVVACMFLLTMMVSTCDLLTEAKYAEKMQAVPEWGPSLMTYVWFGLTFGGLCAMMLIGHVLQSSGPKMVYLICLIPLCTILVPTSMNYLEETPRTSEETAETRRRLFAQREACLLCILMFFGTVTLSVVGIHFESVALNCVAAITVAIIMLLSFSMTLMPIIAKVNAFFLIQTSLSINIGGASFYFYTDTAEQYPDGPHFSMTFYTTVLGVVGSVCSLIGIFLYQKYMQKWRYRELLAMSNIVLALLSISDIMLFTRLNKKWGLPDHAFVLGASVLQTVIAQWMWMPGVIINSQLCPKGMEATMYALLAGCHNLGSNIASNMGALFLQVLGCTPNGSMNETIKFGNLWIACSLSILFPVLTLALLPYLIPDALQTDRLLPEGERDATEGSLWRRWTGRG